MATSMVEQVEQVPQVGDGAPAGVGDGGQGRVEAVGCGGQVARGLGLDDHGRDVVGDDVVEFAGDAGAFGGEGGLGDTAPALGLGGPGRAQPGPDPPHHDQRDIEQRESLHLLGPAEPMKLHRQRHVPQAEHDGGDTPSAF
ncbi:hypothetical protein GCM10023191_041980 [Actinoallomurus oryzae]|uniref:Uncharacterized protein n=1 Tax=Actinoallomurus oryzae TaxID=502180 RepID=A0ABP8Q5X4_9ACTN